MTHLQPGYQLCRLGHISVIPTVISLHLQSHILMVDAVSPECCRYRRRQYTMSTRIGRTQIWTEPTHLNSASLNSLLKVDFFFLFSFSSLSSRSDGVKILPSTMIGSSREGCQVEVQNHLFAAMLKSHGVSIQASCFSHKSWFTSQSVKQSFFAACMPDHLFSLDLGSNSITSSVEQWHATIKLPILQSDASQAAQSPRDI